MTGDSTTTPTPETAASASEAQGAEDVFESDRRAVELAVELPAATVHVAGAPAPGGVASRATPPRTADHWTAAHRATAHRATVTRALTDPRRRAKAVDRARRRFSLLVVRGDGSRVVRFNFPRPLVVGSVTALVAVATATAVIVGDYVKLRRLTREAVSLQRQVKDDREMFEAMNRRMPELRAQMASWREIQARIEQPFGPDAAMKGRARESGLGGPVVKDPAAPAPSPLDELNLLAAAIAEQDANLRALDRVMARASKALASLPSTWPVRGRVASEFGTRKDPWGEGREFHPGLDIGAHMATPVLAPADATVTFAGSQPEYGTLVILDHGQQVRSLYGHLSSLAVKPGQRIERGAVIGYSGNSGRSSGPHLHYEVQVRGQAVNPRTYLFN